MVNQHMFIAMGNAKYSLIFGLMRKIFVLIPLVLVFPFFMGLLSDALATQLGVVLVIAVGGGYLGAFTFNMRRE